MNEGTACTIKDGDLSYSLTAIGKVTVNSYITELRAKRKEILDAEKDTADETNIPDPLDILSDAVGFGPDEDNDYYNNWGVTDHYDADFPICLTFGTDPDSCDILIS